MDRIVPQLVQQHNASEEEVLRGKMLAQTWESIEDEAERTTVMETLRSLWESRGWFDIKPGKSMKQVMRIYGWRD